MMRASRPTNLTFPSDDLYHFVSTLGAWAACTDDKPALVDSITGQRIAYSELGPRTLAVAGALAAIGFEAGEVLSIHLHNCPEYVLAFLACAALGGVSTPSNPQYESMDLSHQLSNSGAIGCLTSERYRPVVASASIEGLRLLHFIEDPMAWVHALPGAQSTVREGGVRPLPDSLLVLPYSSGTTGKAKGVMLTNRSVVANILQSTADPDVRFEITSADTLISLLPCFHIYGLTVQMLASLAMQATLVVTPRFEPQSFLRDVMKHRVSIACMVPPMLVLLDKAPERARADLSSLRACYCGAAPLDAATQARFANEFAVEVRQAYGTTETSLISVATVSRAHNVYGSVGKAVPNTLLKVVDEERREVALSEGGELCVSGPQLMLGYLNRPDATSEALVGGYYHTGDAAHVDADGSLFIGDRKKDMIKVMGFQVAPAEIEGLLLQHPAVADACVIGVTHEISGEVPIAFIVLTYPTFDTAQLASLFAQKVASYKAPQAYLVIDKVPKSASGKILRRKLRDSYQEIRANQGKRDEDGGSNMNPESDAVRGLLRSTLASVSTLVRNGATTTTATDAAAPNEGGREHLDSMQLVTNEFTAARSTGSFSDRDSLLAIRGHVYFAVLFLTIYLHSRINFMMNRVFAGCCASKVLPVSAYFYSLTLLDNLCLAAMPTAIVLAGVEARRLPDAAVISRLLTTFVVLLALFCSGLPESTQAVLEAQWKRGAAAALDNATDWNEHHAMGHETCAAAAQHALYRTVSKPMPPSDSCSVRFRIEQTRFVEANWFLQAIFAWSLFEALARRARALHLLPPLALATHFFCYSSNTRTMDGDASLAAIYPLLTPILGFVPWSLPYTISKTMVFWWLYATAPHLLPDGFPLELPGDSLVRRSSRPAIRAAWACIGALIFWKMAWETPSNGPTYGASSTIEPMSVIGALVYGSTAYRCSAHKGIDCRVADVTAPSWTFTAFSSDVMSIPLTLAIVVGVCAMVPRRHSPLSRAGEQAIWVYCFHGYALTVLDVPVALGVALLAETYRFHIGALVVLTCGLMLLGMAQLSSLLALSLSSLVPRCGRTRASTWSQGVLLGALLWLFAHVVLRTPSSTSNASMTTTLQPMVSPQVNTSKASMPTTLQPMVETNASFFSCMGHHPHHLPVELTPQIKSPTGHGVRALLVGCAVRPTMRNSPSEFLIAIITKAPATSRLAHTGNHSALVVDGLSCGPALAVRTAGLQRFWCWNSEHARLNSPPPDQPRVLKLDLHVKADAMHAAWQLTAVVALHEMHAQGRLLCEHQPPRHQNTSAVALEGRAAGWASLGFRTTFSFAKSRWMCDHLTKHHHGSHCNVWAPPLYLPGSADGASATLRFLCLAYARAAPHVDLLAVSARDEQEDAMLQSVLQCAQSPTRDARGNMPVALYSDPHCSPRSACPAIRRALESRQCTSACSECVQRQCAQGMCLLSTHARPM